MSNRVVALSRKHPRYGYRRITALLRREGRVVNAKRVARVRRAEGLQVRKRQRRLRRVGPGQEERLRATQPNEVWSWDFVADQTEAGSAFRVLTLIDEHTRQCLAAHVAWSIRAQSFPEATASVVWSRLAIRIVASRSRSQRRDRFVACPHPRSGGIRPAVDGKSGTHP